MLKKMAGGHFRVGKTNDHRLGLTFFVACFLIKIHDLILA